MWFVVARHCQNESPEGSWKPFCFVAVTGGLGGETYKFDHAPLPLSSGFYPVQPLSYAISIHVPRSSLAEMFPLRTCPTMLLRFKQQHSQGLMYNIWEKLAFEPEVSTWRLQCASGRT